MLDNIPGDLTELGNEITAKKQGLEELIGKAEKMIENLNSNPVNSDEFDKVKAKGEENTERLDKIQKEDKMLNLLLANLPASVQSIQGFTNFAYNALNVGVNCW